jgi:5'-deoxynucleotidase YfbR-like HD superfamily hydrolase
MSYILTHSGRKFDFSNPQPHMVVLDDVAHALAHLNRYTGHAAYGYSVAQHSVAVSRYLELTGESLLVQFGGLMHDAHEAYFGDISAPLKLFFKLGARARDIQSMVSKEFGVTLQLLADVEDRIQAVVAEAFGVTMDLMEDPRVKLADLTALAVESEVIMPPDDEDWPCLAPVTAVMRAVMPRPYRLTPEQAKGQFLNRYHHLRGQLRAEAEFLEASSANYNKVLLQTERLDPDAVIEG